MPYRFFIHIVCATCAECCHTFRCYPSAGSSSIQLTQFTIYTQCAVFVFHLFYFFFYLPFSLSLSNNKYMLFAPELSTPSPDQWLGEYTREKDTSCRCCCKTSENTRLYFHPLCRMGILFFMHIALKNATQCNDGNYCDERKAHTNGFVYSLESVLCTKTCLSLLWHIVFCHQRVY